MMLLTMVVFYLSNVKEDFKNVLDDENESRLFTWIQTQNMIGKRENNEKEKEEEGERMCGNHFIISARSHMCVDVGFFLLCVFVKLFGFGCWRTIGEWKQQISQVKKKGGKHWDKKKKSITFCLVRNKFFFFWCFGEWKY